MEGFLIVLIIVAAIVGAILWNKAKSAAVKAANQKVLFRGAHRDGQEAVGQATVFTTSASPARVLEAVRGWGWPTAAESVMTGNVWTPAATESQIDFVSGSKLGESFRAALTMTPTSSGGTQGTYRVLRWRTSDGIVSDRKQMSIIRDRLVGTVRGLDASATITSVDDPAPRR